MTTLIIAEHNHQSITPGTLATIAAGQKIGNDIHVIVMGSGVEAVAKSAAAAEGVAEVLTADHADLKHPLAEPMTEVLKTIAGDYTHILAPSSTFGKNLLPRLAAQLDVGQLTDVISV